jgi:hypothetical protein
VNQTTKYITLSRQELAEACDLAEKRMNGVKDLGLHDKHGASNLKNLEYHLLGARGEIAFRKFLGSDEALTVNTFRSTPDVKNYEVRTRREDHFDLILRKDDPDHKIYVLVTGSGCKYKIVGWIRGSERYEHETKTYNDRPKAWFVPQSALHQMDDLPA